MNREDQLMALMKSAAAQLAEHADAVVILATGVDGDRSFALNVGEGNHYTRMGLCRDLIERDENENLALRIVAEIASIETTGEN